uniref:Calnexin n=1 Tax=Nannochloropsis gaditana (strain CCMP526) TaxID=1093141 RepID=I2CQT1_NANGC
MRLASSFLPVILAAFTPVSILGKALFLEEFQGTDNPLSQWHLSKKEKYADQPIEVSSSRVPGSPDESSLLLKEAMKHYGLATFFDEAQDFTDQALVFQYEVKMEEPLQCGGAYMKLLGEGAVAAPDALDNETPYVIMFGPDKCGATNKVHFILRHQNPITGEWEEKHAQGVPAVKTDKKSHLYTLVIRPDNTFEILIDNVVEKKGSLLTDMDPPVNPPEMIDDPTDSKPQDWVDEAKIPDPTASKPEDWDEDAPATIPDMDVSKPEGWLDDAPEMVPDPEASKPEDWDEEEDGAWEAPLVLNPACEEGPGCGEWKRPTKPNPAYKGKWFAPLIDNPAYKGVWAPRQVPNPSFFRDEHPHNIPSLAGVAIEVWTTNRGLRFDSIYLGKDPAHAAAHATRTWKVKYDAELAEEEAAIQANKMEAAKGLQAKARLFVEEGIRQAKKQPLAAFTSALALLISFLYLLRPKGGKKEEREEEGKEETKGEEEEKEGEEEEEEDEDEDEEDEEDEEEEEEEVQEGRRSTRGRKKAE